MEDKEEALAQVKHKVAGSCHSYTFMLSLRVSKRVWSVGDG
ncbi:hypothetical protein [Spirosoma fluviale]|uniref:Uncharacterized protein n=1 Tax=Spirosoma fluviale TaxID=1597977 RepID=A0A286F6F3_9BACT|nr:hypothetical protein [Spirosoma fluviale]SOD78676.1 hypothetical protein SAMN06269250_0583 [Spirosoma fluviale]